MNRFLSLLRQVAHLYAWNISPSGMIRGKHPINRNYYCPFEAVLFRVTGRHRINLVDMAGTASELGLFEYQLHEIIKAADNFKGHDKQLRTNILECLGTVINEQVSSTAA